MADRVERPRAAGRHPPCRWLWGVLSLWLLGLSTGTAGAQARATALPQDVTYVLPVLLSYQSLSDAAFAQQVADLRTRLGEGPLARVGFTVYINISMDSWAVDVHDSTAVRAALASTIAQIDSAISRAAAQTPPLPICLNFLTAIRSSYDPAQAASELEDRRTMQWYTDNGLANGWWTHSQYARKQRAIQEAYVREIGRILADRITRYPDIVVAASGDGEVELSYDRAETPGSPYLADYSPFTVAEFRDWLQLAGLYASGQPLAGEGYSLGARYAGDASPADDTNGDGHTLNGDFGTSFTTWDLRYFNWSLTDDPWSDPNAIPATAYTAPGWDPLPDAGATRFDAPRVRQWGNAWWDVWFRFKQEMIWRHNRDFAKWITASADPVSGNTVPSDRWYSYQIPADYLFGYSPEQPNWRYDTSASAWWTADVYPYGGLGITAFNVNQGGGAFARTLVNVAPHIAERNRRWGILEWNPSDPSTDDPDIYRQEMAIVEQYRPSLLVPFAWGHSYYKVQDSGFEVALKELIGRIKDASPSQALMSIDVPASGQAVAQPFRVAGWAIDQGTVRGPGRHCGVDAVHVYAYPNPGSGAAPVFLGAATIGTSRPDVGQVYGSQFAGSGFELSVTGLAHGRYQLVVYARSTVTGTFNDVKSLDVTVDPASLAVDRSQIRFSAIASGSQFNVLTSDQEIVLTQSGGSPVSWAATASQPWLRVSPSSGTGSGKFTISVANPISVAAGTSQVQGTVSVTSADSASAPSVSVTVSLFGSGATTPPFGVIDTPVNNATGVVGAIGVTGWALDDVQVAKVQVWRDPVPADPAGAIAGNGKVYIGDAAFLAGARPDVEAAYPAYPLSYRGGWGYQLLTNMLPDRTTGGSAGGNGQFTLYAYATDVEDHVTLLGSRTITVDNANATKPFGTLDTPLQGGTASGGAYSNFGWALATTGRLIPTDGSTMWVFIDGVSVGHPVYNQCRAARDAVGNCTDDIATLFPGRLNVMNGNAAIGYYHIDTTALSNGLHTVAWSVTDDGGQTEGIGSRFFTVFNASSDVAVSERMGAVEAMGLGPARVLMRRGFDRNEELQEVAAGADGVRRVHMFDLDRVEVWLGDGVGGAAVYDGFMTAGSELRPLPPGSTLDRRRGILYWQPAVGYFGTYTFVFVRTTPDGRRDRIPVSIQIAPRFDAGTTSRMWIDTPAWDATVTAPFLIGGWALDLAAWLGSGVDAVHVWAYPDPGSGEPPFFMGAADVGGFRPDVVAAFGRQFDAAGYGLVVQALPPGLYDLVVYAHSQVLGTFHDARTVRVRVQ